jgi:hypothetical protein
MNEAEETAKLKSEISALRSDVKELLELRKGEKGFFEFFDAIDWFSSTIAWIFLICLVCLALVSFISFYKENWIGIIVIFLAGCFLYLWLQVLRNNGKVGIDSNDS